MGSALGVPEAKRHSPGLGKFTAPCVAISSPEAPEPQGLYKALSQNGTQERCGAGGSFERQLGCGWWMGEQGDQVFQECGIWQMWLWAASDTRKSGTPPTPPHVTWQQ